MEYISKQSLLADLNEATPRSYFAFETMVREYPTEDVVPVVHAHWFESYWGATGAECSNCHCVIPTYDMDYQEVKHDFKYCPYCGAKMDEEVE